MRRTRGEILRRFFREVAYAVFDFAAVEFEDLVAADFLVCEVAGFLEVSVCAGPVLWSTCRARAREDAHTEPQAMPLTRIRIEVRE